MSDYLAKLWAQRRKTLPRYVEEHELLRCVDPEGNDRLKKDHLYRVLWANYHRCTLGLIDIASGEEVRSYHYRFERLDPIQIDNTPGKQDGS